MTNPINTEIKETGNYKKPSLLKKAVGIYAGSFATSCTILGSQVLSQKFANKLQLINDTLEKSEIDKISEAIPKVIKKTGLDKKGVEIVKATSENSDVVSNILKKEASVGLSKFLPKKIKEMLYDHMKSSVSAGENAFYAFNTKKIVLPEGKLSLATFHEIGHAMNANLNTITKNLQGIRGAVVLSSVILLFALFKNKKAEGEKPKNKLDAAGDFVKNNAGKLTFLTCLPMLAEEGLASLRGQKAAKEFLSSDLAKKVAKTNAYAFATYAIFALALSIGIALGVKIKDKIAGKKAQKQINQKN